MASSHPQLLGSVVDVLSFASWGVGVVAGSGPEC